MDHQAVIFITGIQAAGKSTVAQLLAERLPRSVHVRGDLFRRMVVNGREEMTPDPTPEALRQLSLRYRIAASVTDNYFDAGFTVVVQDIVLGPNLSDFVNAIHARPLHVIVLAPRPEVVSAREAGRDKTAYDDWTVQRLDAILREHTPRIGVWLDTSDQTPAQTVDEILSRLSRDEGTINAHHLAPPE